MARWSAKVRSNEDECSMKFKERYRRSYGSDDEEQLIGDKYDSNDDQDNGSKKNKKKKRRRSKSKSKSRRDRHSQSQSQSQSHSSSPSPSSGDQGWSPRASMASLPSLLSSPLVAPIVKGVRRMRSRSLGASRTRRSSSKTRSVSVSRAASLDVDDNVNSGDSERHSNQQRRQRQNCVTENNELPEGASTPTSVSSIQSVGSRPSSRRRLKQRHIDTKRKLRPRNSNANANANASPDDMSSALQPITPPTSKPQHVQLRNTQHLHGEIENGDRENTVDNRGNVGYSNSKGSAPSSPESDRLDRLIKELEPSELDLQSRNHIDELKTSIRDMRHTRRRVSFAGGLTAHERQRHMLLQHSIQNQQQRAATSVHNDSNKSDEEEVRPQSMKLYSQPQSDPLSLSCRTKPRRPQRRPVKRTSQSNDASARSNSCHDPPRTGQVLSSQTDHAFGADKRPPSTASAGRPRQSQSVGRPGRSKSLISDSLGVMSVLDTPKTQGLKFGITLEDLDTSFLMTSSGPPLSKGGRRSQSSVPLPPSSALSSAESKLLSGLPPIGTNVNRDRLSSMSKSSSVLEAKVKKAKRVLKRMHRDIEADKASIVRLQRGNWSIRKQLYQQASQLEYTPANVMNTPGDRTTATTASATSITALSMQMERCVRQEQQITSELEEWYEQKYAIEEECAATTCAVEQLQGWLAELQKHVVPLLPADPTDESESPMTLLAQRQRERERIRLQREQDSAVNLQKTKQQAVAMIRALNASEADRPLSAPEIHPTKTKTHPRTRSVVRSRSAELPSYTSSKSPTSTKDTNQSHSFKFISIDPSGMLTTNRNSGASSRDRVKQYSVAENAIHGRDVLMASPSTRTPTETPSSCDSTPKTVARNELLRLYKASAPNGSGDDGGAGNDGGAFDDGDDSIDSTAGQDDGDDDGGEGLRPSRDAVVSRLATRQ